MSKSLTTTEKESNAAVRCETIGAYQRMIVSLLAENKAIKATHAKVSADYAACFAENERLRATVEATTKAYTRLMKVQAAENERLRANRETFPYELSEHNREYFANVERENERLRSLLDDLVGPGSQHEATCDKAEHDADGPCIYCAARAALAATKG